MNRPTHHKVRTTTLLHRCLKVIPQHELNRIARSYGIDDNQSRVNVEYALQSTGRDSDVAREVAYTITKLLNTETACSGSEATRPTMEDAIK